MTVAQILQSLEEQLVDPVLRRAPEKFESLFADEFREFGSSGRTFDKQQILAAIRCERHTPPQLSEFATTFLAPNLALVTYRAERPGNLASLRSSLWIFREQRWQILFHQGTIIP